MGKETFNDVSLTARTRRSAAIGVDDSIRGHPEVRVRSLHSEFFTIAGISSVTHIAISVVCAIICLLISSRAISWKHSSDVAVYILLMMIAHLVGVLFAIVGRVTPPSGGVSYHWRYYVDSYVPIFWVTIFFIYQAVMLVSAKSSDTTSGMTIVIFFCLYVGNAVNIIFYSFFTIPSLVEPIRDLSPGSYYAKQVAKVHPSNANHRDP